MRDTEPLLSTRRESSNETKLSQIIRRYFGRESTNNTQNKSSISFVELFRYADRIDYILLSIGVCGSLLRGINFVINTVLYAQMTSLFALKSFNENIDSMISLRKNILNKIQILLICGSFSFIGVLLQHFLFELSAKRQTTRIRKRLFETILQRDISYFDTNPISQLNTRLFNNVDKLELGIGYRLSMLITALIAVVLGVLFSMFINFKLTLIMLCFIPLTCFGTHLFFKVNINETSKEIESYSKAGHIVHEVFSSVRTVFTFNGQEFEQNRYEKELDQSQMSTLRKGFILGFLSGWIYLLKYLIYSNAFIFGFILLNSTEDDQSQLTDIVSVTFIFGQCVSNISFVVHFLQSCSEAQTIGTDVFQLISECEQSTSIEKEMLNDDKITDENFRISSEIQFHHVNFGYPARKELLILKDFNITIRSGEITALVGPSGSGKSTIVSLLLRYYDCSSGQISINNKSITDFNLREYRQRIGVVSQEPFLFGTTIYENILYGNRRATRQDIEEAARQANAHDFIMKLPKKYETLVGERGIQLSGGEKQRIALARALIKKPDLLILDEATSALDNLNEKIVQDALDRACHGRTTLIIAHRLTTIRNANQIYVMDKGSIVEQGTHQSLMFKQEKYFRLVKDQIIIEIANNSVHSDDQTTKRETAHPLVEFNSIDIDQNDRFLSNKQNLFLRLLILNRPEWKIILIGCCSCVFTGMSQSIYSYLINRIIQGFGLSTKDEQKRHVITSSCLLLLLGFLCLLSRIIQYSSFSLSGSKLTKRIRSQAFQSLLRQEVSYFDRPENSSGPICTRLSSNALAIQDMSGTRLGNFVELISMFCFAMFLGCLFNIEFTLISCLFFLLIFIIIVIHINSESNLKKKTRHFLERASSIAVESIHHMRTVKQLSIEDFLLQIFSDLIDQTFQIRRKHLFISTIRFAIGWALPTYVLAALYSFALFLVEHHRLEMKNIILVLSFVIFFIQSSQTLLILSNELGASLSAAQIFVDLFDRIPMIDNSSTQGKHLINLQGQIEFEKVTFIYPTRPTSAILNNFQLSIKPSQRIALVGPSGSGKSTAIQLLERFYDVSSGRILIDGIDIKEINLHSIRSCFGLVAQEPILFNLTIAENIKYGLKDVTDDQIIEAATKANIHSFIEKLPQRYETNVGQKGTLLSGGEKQRIAIARVILRRPNVLLLDEATSAMDSHNEKIVQNTLKQIQDDEFSRTTTITVAHRLSTIVDCDLIYVVDQGTVIECGTHQQLLDQKGIYWQMINKQNV